MRKELNEVAQVRRLDGLYQIGVRPQFVSALDFFGVGNSAQDNGEGSVQLRLGIQKGQNVEAVGRRHPQIEEDDGWRRILLAVRIRISTNQIVDGLLAFVQHDDWLFGAKLLQREHEQLRVVRGIIHNENCSFVQSFVHKCRPKKAGRWGKTS